MVKRKAPAAKPKDRRIKQDEPVYIIDGEKYYLRKRPFKEGIFDAVPEGRRSEILKRTKQPNA